MFIQTEQTPNPATLKFLPGKTVMDDGVAEFTEPTAAERLSPLAARVFKVEGVTGVYLGGDFISVTKAAGEDWQLLKPAVLGAIMEHFLSGDPAALEGARLASGGESAEDDPTVRQIKELIETRVRPAVAQDGGDIVFHGFERGVVYLHLRGACSGCPSSIVTLKNGIENLLKYYVPEVVEVRAISLILLRLLAFDTAGAAISAAAGQDGALLSARREALARGHAERLLPLLRQVLAEAGWAWRNIDLVVVTEGPGNFTGLRAGIAVARALALALGCPVLGIGTLELLAEAGAAAEPENRLPIQAVLDARRDEVYCQRFAHDLTPLTAPTLGPLASAVNGLPSPCLLVGDAAAGVASQRACDDRVIEAELDARYLARAAWRRLAGGAVAGRGTMLRPVYLRQPDARIGAGASILAARS